MKWLPHDAAYRKLQNPKDWWRTIEVQLAAHSLDTLRGANWQRSGDPNAPRPEPILGPPPGTEVEEAPKAPKMTPAEIREELARRQAANAARVEQGDE
ncbi:hypothetical protein QT969_10435 [Rhodococcus sp. CSLK01-03]|uniref:Uncharacterized protein n=1 Tax=Rhodococcus indonesiensis TaxID=3055869 RepID=A0ABT7RM40_9NOCA|nr:hypothetical protein [Rhodococcus indonesiensis]MDM7488708.1 hypothetical protein [Rhodococcus indonesiensis]